MMENLPARHSPYVAEIQQVVADFFCIQPMEMGSPRRAREVARPRQIAMYLSKQLTHRSLPEIGRHFGGRDHTTVIHAVRTIETLRQTDYDVETSIQTLLKRVALAVAERNVSPADNEDEPELPGLAA
jgi:chromosomal replication initiator protein